MAGGFGGWLPTSAGGAGGGAPAASDATYAVRKQRTSDRPITETSWANFDTSMDIVLTASAGQWIEVGVNGVWQSEAPFARLDVVSVVAGSPVQNWSIDAAESSSTLGAPGWNGIASVLMPIGGTLVKPLESSEISAGTVTLRLRCKTSAATKTMLENFCFFALNRG